MLALLLLAQAPAFFEPPVAEARLRVQVQRRDTPPVLDGKLDDWPLTPTVDGGFIQHEPSQGSAATRHTAVWLAYDDTAFYVAARLSQTEAFNQRDLRRDFEWVEADSFGVLIDPFGDGRLANSFQVNPYGAQRDSQVLEDELTEVNWDTLWRSATSRDEHGWVVELAIPFRSFRYGTGDWGLQLVRRQRSINEDSTLTPVPRSVTPWRMTYAALLDGLHPPPPRAFDVQLRPYLALRGTKMGERPIALEPSGGGEVRWMPSATTVVDLTGNTDFAETDVDRRVVNLTRYSVLFPERRQFFLESAGIFTVHGTPEGLQPFFSRRVGLDEGFPSPVYGGARLVHRSEQRSIGALVVATGPTERLLRAEEGGTLKRVPASFFGVARYAHHLGETNRLGGLVTFRHDLATDGSEATTNLVPTLDGFARLGSFTLSGVAMGSFTHFGQTSLFGGAGAVRGAVQSNIFSADLHLFVLTPHFRANSGFIPRENVFGLQFEAGFDLRPSWLPRFLRNTGPWAEGALLFSSSSFGFQEASLTLSPLWIQFTGGDEAWLFVEGSAQAIDDEFRPVAALPVTPGRYVYGRAGAEFFTQMSRRFSVGANASLGVFYGYDELRAGGNVSVQPIPHVQLAARYGFNRFANGGLPSRGVETHLLLLESRLALSPKLQLIGSFQRDTAANQQVVNARLAWEYLPLSFIYLVLTDTRGAISGPLVTPETRVVLKATYTWQP